MTNAKPLAAAGSDKQMRDPETIASYVAELSGDLAHMARGQGLDTLGYILEMAKLEAENITRGAKSRR